jgi:hypothetical protein
MDFYADDGDRDVFEAVLSSGGCSHLALHVLVQDETDDDTWYAGDRAMG